MKALIWVGAAMVVLGVFLPWVSVSSPMGSASKTGFEINQGIISIGVGLLGALLGFVSSRRNESAKTFAALTILSALVVGAMAISVLMEVARQSGGPNLPDQFRNLGLHIRANAEIGVFLSLVGGIVLLLGGVGALKGARAAS